MRRQLGMPCWFFSIRQWIIPRVMRVSESSGPTEASTWPSSSILSCFPTTPHKSLISHDLPHPNSLLDSPPSPFNTILKTKPPKQPIITMSPSFRISSLIPQQLRLTRRHLFVSASATLTCSCNGGVRRSCCVGG